MTPRILAALALFATTAAAADPIAGYDRLDVRASHRAYPVAASVWYPVGSTTYVAPIGDNPIFRGTPAFVGAGIADGQFPLFVFSHGSGGNMDTVSWLSSELANRGAMVLSVNHPGSTSGDSSPRRSVRLDERAADLSAALDALLVDPAFAAHIDPTRVISVGFSLGGATALNLAGLRFDAKAYASFCDDTETTMADCIFFAKGGVVFENLPAGFSADMRDHRVTAVAAIDPAFTYVATDESIAQMTMPVALINLGEEHRLPAVDVGENGSAMAERLQNVTYSVIAPANHFTFLANCRDGASEMLAEEGEDPICDDPATTDRQAVHMTIADQIAEFSGL